ncbi:MAG: ribosome-associated translation inhibitor RaiA [Erysipelotrichaceae bacterium]|jgi:putative sigma-54 modulation protein|nr:ribosome-associated translation inhibitor RaiA [Erysipelotrichaceae bacterium]
MKFAIYGENVTINDKMREKIENRLSELNKYVVIDEAQSAKVTVKIYGDALKVEVNVPTKVGLMRSEVVHEDFSTAVDLAIDKLEDQIRRQKGRLSRRHKESLAENFYEIEEIEEENDTPVRTKTVYADEMILDEAIMRMEMLSHSFFIYRDADSEKLAVVYKRNDGGYGLIEISE